MNKFFLILAGLFLASTVSAATLQVGPTRTYATPQAAMTAAVAGDVIEIEAERWSGASAQLLINKNVTIRGIPGVHGLPQFDCQDTGVFSIGCWVVDLAATDVTVERVEIYNFRTPASASCIRVNTPGKFILKHSHLHDCQQGLLTSNQGTQQFWIENSTFANNGVPGGQTHNVYLGDSAEAVFIRNRSYNSNGGQLYKSRARKNVVAFNDLGDPRATPASNYEIDLSCGGDAYVVGNKIHQSRGSTNQRIVTFAPEACQAGEQRLTVVGNTVYNEATGSQPVFVQARKQANATTFDLVIEHNILLGSGAIFFTPDTGLAPDLTTNTVRALPAPPISFVGPPEGVQHAWIAGGIQLAWLLPPGATGAIVRRGTTVITGSATTATDAGPFTPGATVTYDLRSLQGTAESVPTTYTLTAPLPLPTNPTSASFTKGWYEVANSRYQTVYPQPPPFATKHLVEAWSGAGYDPVNNAFLLFGGGSPDYAGNEVVKVPLQGVPTILMPASTNLDIAALPNPVEALVDGQPAWRHSYGGLAYAPELQKLFVFGGFLPRSVPSNGLWALSTFCLAWERLAYTGDTPEATFGSNAVWNPTDGQVWIKTGTHLYSYNPSTRVMTKRNTTPMPVSIYHAMALDVGRQALVLSDGAAIREITLAGTPAMTTMKTFLPEEAFASWPGMAYDPDLQRVVMWSGGSRFGVVSASGYSEATVLGGPGAQTITGTHDRLAYVPQWKVFALQNLASQNLFVVKLE